MGIEPGNPGGEISALTIRLQITVSSNRFVNLFTGKPNIRSNCITTAEWRHGDAFFGSKLKYFQILLVLFNYFNYKEWTPQIKNLFNQHIALKIYFVSTVLARLLGHSTIGSTHLSGQGNACHVCSATASQRNSLILFALNATNNTQRKQITFFKKCSL